MCVPTPRTAVLTFQSIQFFHRETDIFGLFNCPLPSPVLETALVAS